MQSLVIRAAWGVGGCLCLMFLAWLLSNNRKRFPWRVAIWGVGLQFLFAAFILKTKVGLVIFDGARAAITKILSFTDRGAEFLFGNLYRGTPFSSEQGYFQLYDAKNGVPADIGIVFALHVLMTIVFFASIMSVLYHIGVMQIVVKAIAKVMQWCMKTSGAETLSCAGNIFVGQTEAPLLVKPYLERMTKSEIMVVMTGGFATAAGGVLAAYTRFGIDPGHLLTASVMSAPAALVMAKIAFPETEEAVTAGTMKVQFEKVTSNVVDAAATGARDGLFLAFNVAAMLMAFIAIIALVNWGLGYLDDTIVKLAHLDQPVGTSLAAKAGLAGAGKLSLALVFGFVFYPIALVIGVPPNEALQAGYIIGTQISINEFVAYIEMGKLREVLSPRTFTILTYALCGFCNFSSIAIQIGGISAIAPGRRADLAKIGPRAMLCGALACWQTAAIAGVLVSPEEAAERVKKVAPAWTTRALDYQAQIETYQGIAKEYPGTVFAQQSETRVGALRREARETLDMMLRTAARHKANHDHDGANAVYDRIEEFCKPGVVDAYAAALDQAGRAPPEERPLILQYLVNDHAAPAPTDFEKLLAEGKWAEYAERAREHLEATAIPPLVLRARAERTR